MAFSSAISMEKYATIRFGERALATVSPTPRGPHPSPPFAFIVLRTGVLFSKNPALQARRERFTVSAKIGPKGPTRPLLQSPRLKTGLAPDAKRPDRHAT